MELAPRLPLGERFPSMDDETAAKYVLLDFELIALVALATGVLLYAAAKRLRRDPFADREGPPDYDGFDLVLMFFPALLFLLNPIAEAFMAEKGGPGGDAGGTAETSAPDVVSVLMSIGYFAFVGVMTYGLIEWVRNRRVAALFGLRRLRLRSIVPLSLGRSAVSLLLCGWLVGGFANHYLEGVFGELDLQEPVKMLRESESVVHLVLSVAMACVAAPLLEELLFRGYIYGTLRHFTHPVFAAVVVGALFAVIHGNLPALLPLWAFSILLTTAYELTRCLWVPVGMHVVFNAANIAMMLAPSPAE